MELHCIKHVPSPKDLRVTAYKISVTDTQEDMPLGHHERVKISRFDIAA